MDFEALHGFDATPEVRPKRIDGSLIPGEMVDDLFAEIALIGRIGNAFHRRAGLKEVQIPGMHLNKIPIDVGIGGIHLRNVGVRTRNRVDIGQGGFWESRNAQV